MDAVQPAELRDRPRVVVDPQVDQRVREARVPTVLLDDEQRGGLLATPVAAGGLRGVEAVEQALGERAGARLEGLGERVHRRTGDEDVALRGVAGAGAPAGPVVAARARERGCAALAVDDAGLALVATLVGLGQPRERVLGGEAVAQERSPSGP